jgi:autotransporter-associated beta strand protein
LDLQGYSETVHAVSLGGGTISGTAAAKLTSATEFQLQSGIAEVQLAGSVGLAKSTAATAILQGANTYTGSTAIHDGLLLVDGTHSGGAGYTIAPQGTLGGIGTINAPVVIDGTIAPGQSIGTLTLDNVTLRSGSKLAIELSGASADLLVAKDLNLDEDESLDIAALSPLAGQSWLITQYSGIRNGEFNQVTPGYFVDYAVPGQLVLRLATGDFDRSGHVDAADYVVWRNGLGTVYDADDYDLWRANFGKSFVTASGAGVGAAAPEPSCVVLAWMWAMATTIYGRGQRCNRPSMRLGQFSFNNGSTQPYAQSD